MTTSQTIFLIAMMILFLAGFLALARKWTGWDRLTKHYRSPGKFKATHWWYLISAFMGIREGEHLLGVELPLFSMRSSLNISVNEWGVRISVFPLFRLFHPPLYVPWSHVSVKRESGLLWDWLDFRFREAPEVVLRLRAGIAEKVVKQSPAELVDLE